jgi:hypothetical protein
VQDGSDVIMCFFNVCLFLLICVREKKNERRMREKEGEGLHRDILKYREGKEAIDGGKEIWRDRKTKRGERDTGR